jgi:Tol biopolymer transport system component
MRSFSRRAAAAAAASLGLALLVPGVAGAAFPGANGSIVYQSTASGLAPCNPYTSNELFQVSPSVASPTPSQVDCTGSTDQHAFVSPDGSEVVFASNRGGGSGSFQLYTEALPAQGSSPSPAGATDVSYPQNAGVDDYPSWAPASSGNQGPIIFQRTLPGGVPQLYTENVNEPSIPATPVFSTPTGFSDTEPVYDPSNANEILFVRQASGGPQQIFEYNLSTPATAPVNLSAADGDSSSNDSKPDFAPSPTGSPLAQQIVFQSDRSSAAASGGPCAGTQLYTMTDQPGSPITPVFQVQSGGVPTGQQACPKSNGTNVATENPVFSPDGNQIAYDEPGPSTQNVYTFYMDYSGNAGLMNTATDLTPNYATDEAPNWAPVFPGASTPEAPYSIMMPLSGVGVIGGGVLVMRHRKRRAGEPQPAG